MKKKLLVSLVFSIAVWFSLGAYAEKTAVTADQAPCAYFPENTYTFATVIEGTNISHDFKLLNKGNAPLSIEKVRTG